MIMMTIIMMMIMVMMMTVMIMMTILILTRNYHGEEELYKRADYAAIAIERELPLHDLI